jgi:hypothetical protein
LAFIPSIRYYCDIALAFWGGLEGQMKNLFPNFWKWAIVVLIMAVMVVCVVKIKAQTLPPVTRSR